MNEIQKKILQFYEGNWKSLDNDKKYVLEIIDNSAILKKLDSSDKVISEETFFNKPFWSGNILFFVTPNNGFDISFADETHLLFGEHNEPPKKYERIK